MSNDPDCFLSANDVGSTNTHLSQYNMRQQRQETLILTLTSTPTLATGANTAHGFCVASHRHAAQSPPQACKTIPLLTHNIRRCAFTSPNRHRMRATTRRSCRCSKTTCRVSARSRTACTCPVLYECLHKSLYAEHNTYFNNITCTSMGHLRLPSLQRDNRI